ncbi:MAG TPA: Plug domain-containing protein, partial [Accumulibacter sp.]|uniref:Plug domain-containing protein n=1 Tax=Accumulibacter sp. TaxID=2053492 RepID=UPI002BC811CE
MKFRINRTAALIAAFGASGMVPAVAADGATAAAAAGAERPAQLAPVVVEESRLQPLPAANRVDEETLRALRPATSDTASMLRDVPGVQLQGAGGVSSLPVIRGLADDRNRIIVDGMDLIASCPNHMNPPLSYLDPNGVSK